MPPTSQRMEPAMTAEDEAQRLIDRYYKARGPHYSAGSCSQILRSDLLDLLRELIALRAKPAAMDGDVEAIPMCSVHSLQLGTAQLWGLRTWWDAFGNTNTPLAVLNMVNETLSLLAQVESLRAEMAKMSEQLRWRKLGEEKPRGGVEVLLAKRVRIADVLTDWVMSTHYSNALQGWSIDGCRRQTPASPDDRWLPMPSPDSAPPSPAPDAEGKS